MLRSGRRITRKNIGLGRGTRGEALPESPPPPDRDARRDCQDGAVLSSESLLSGAASTAPHPAVILLKKKKFSGLSFLFFGKPLCKMRVPDSLVC